MFFTAGRQFDLALRQKTDIDFGTGPQSKTKTGK
jgi:hypothetical protein